MGRARRWAAFFALAVLFAAVPATAYGVGERTLGLSATSFDFSTSAGGSGAGTVWVLNDGTSDIYVRVYASDQVIGPTGEVTYVTPTLEANPQQSPASWVTVKLPDDAKASGNIPYIALPAGARVQVDFTVTVPNGAVPGDHQTILFFEMHEPNEQVAPGTTRTSARVGARIKTRVEGRVLEDLAAEPFWMRGFVIGSKVPYTLRLVNDGNVDERVNARIALLDSSDAEVETSDVATDTSVYAGTQIERAGFIDVSGVGPKRYRLTVSYASQAPDANGLEMTLEKERVVWAIPMWLAILVVIVIGLLAVYISWLLGQRSAVRRATTSDRALARAKREAVRERREERENEAPPE